jgi:hypothetical protein
MEVAVQRPQRWDEPFGEPLREAEVDELLAIEPFCGIDPAAFPPSLSLREILRNDARLERYAAGDILVREGDYGSSAFLILDGRVRVVLSGLTPEALGRAAPQPLGWLATLSRVLLRPKLAEVRDAANPSPSPARPSSPQASLRGRGTI